MSRRRRAGRVSALLIAVVAVLGLPAMAVAHPLGNFTINHYAGLRIEPDRILLDVVIDQAEIPTFQARLDFDLDGDGEVSDDEADAGRVTACAGMTPFVDLAVDGVRQAPILTDAGLTFPPGVGGLSTMRFVCQYEAALTTPITTATTVSYRDMSYPDRLGWREIVVEGSGVTATIVEGVLRQATISDRLSMYPTDLLTQAPQDGSIVVTLAAGGRTLEPWSAPDAATIPGSGSGQTPSPGDTPTSGPSAAPVAAGVTGGTGGTPGGVTGGELPSIFREANLTPIVLLVSLFTAGALGAGHALTPGHGKTLMAAYLVGTRGTVWHAAGLGLSVTVSHTIGILVLAALVVGAQDVLAPDLVVRAAPFVAAVSIVAIGGWMLLSEIRRRRTARAVRTAAVVAHDHLHETHDHGHDHPRADGAPGHSHAPSDAEMHSHGGVTHSHLPPAGSTITWRSLFVLGLAGGLIPSTSALLILLGSIAAGRAGFGFVLVIAFGLGMALVMGGIGIALVLARGRVDRMAPSSAIGRLSGAIPLAAAVLVFSLGLYLTAQAVGGTPVL